MTTLAVSSLPRLAWPAERSAVRSCRHSYARGAALPTYHALSWQQPQIPSSPRGERHRRVGRAGHSQYSPR